MRAIIAPDAMRRDAYRFRTAAPPVRDLDRKARPQDDMMQVVTLALQERATRAAASVAKKK